MILILKPALLTRSMLWLFIFHSLQVYRNRWTKWFWIWVDVSTKERNGGVGTTYLASRTNARLSQIRLPVRYCRVKYAFSCFHSEGPHLFHNATLVLSTLNQILGIIFVWEPKRVCSLCQPSLLGTKPSCSSGNSKSLVLKSWRYRTVIKHRNLAQWFFVFLRCWFHLLLVRKPHLLIMKWPRSTQLVRSPFPAEGL